MIDISFYDYLDYGCLIPQDEFPLYGAKACAIFESVTCHRMDDVVNRIREARKYEPFPKSAEYKADEKLLKMAKKTIYMAADAAYEYRKPFTKALKGIKSETNDGVSVAYTDIDLTALNKEEERLIYQVIRGALGGTGLLYRGVE